MTHWDHDSLGLLTHWDYDSLGPWLTGTMAHWGYGLLGLSGAARVTALVSLMVKAQAWFNGAVPIQTTHVDSMDYPRYIYMYYIIIIIIIIIKRRSGINPISPKVIDRD